MTSQSKFDKHPAVSISETESDCALGWSEILDFLHAHGDARRIAIECYPGVLLEPLRRELVMRLEPELVLESAQSMLPAVAIEAKFAKLLGDDPVFGHMIPVVLDEFFDPDKIHHARRVAENTRGRIVAIGTGATLLMPAWDLLIYVDVARWEIQQRQRRGMAPSLGLANARRFARTALQARVLRRLASR